MNKSGKFISINYCDIGSVRDWGIPSGAEGVRNYWRYPTTPWKISVDRNIRPDLILIDGRFRVACFLYSWICADEGTTILFDDYTVRPEYHVVERISEPVSTHGRLAEFKKISRFNQLTAIDYLLEYSSQYE